MLKNLELSSLKADLANVESLLATRQQDDDPIGWYQFSQRKSQLEEAIQALAAQDSNHAAVALYFGGRPVIGSRGIDATFAGRAIGTFQAIVAKRNATAGEGKVLKDRGRVPKKNDAALLVTEVARGSFGFVLEEAAKIEQEQLLDTPLKRSVEEVTTLIRDLVKNDIEDAAEFLDDRILISLREFFALLDDSGATMRIVEGDKDFQLDRDDISIAREKTDTIALVESERWEYGVLYITPDSQRFDLEVAPPNEVVKGRVDPDLLARLRQNQDQELKKFLGARVRANLAVKDVTSVGRQVRSTFTLTDIEPG
ncbi:hypothetical protein [Achromobacter denitrificans]|uniref:hypothetical protein n=1 Tax=Achromobacter denitrificans TaxID=32002 RepID=UPI000F674D88|nr:hypothetical protein [Achromobacter denitrificans]RSE88616.1 hypothetical protein EGU64_05185 [Achromobacter denitrificans]